MTMLSDTETLGDRGGNYDHQFITTAFSRRENGITDLPLHHCKVRQPVVNVTRGQFSVRDADVHANARIFFLERL